MKRDVKNIVPNDVANSLLVWSLPSVVTPSLRAHEVFHWLVKRLGASPAARRVTIVNARHLGRVWVCEVRGPGQCLAVGGVDGHYSPVSPVNNRSPQSVGTRELAMCVGRRVLLICCTSLLCMCLN